MKKITSIIFLFFFLIKFSLAQTNYIDYHKKIIQAEEFFLNKKFDSSFKAYKDIFTQYKNPFAKDCFVALQIACQKEDTGYARFFFEKCFENGVNWKALDISAHVNSFFLHRASMQKDIQELYKTSRANYLKSIDCNLRSKIAILTKRDATYKHIPSDWKTKRVRDSIYSAILDENIQDLITIVKQFGIPGEHLIGIIDPEIDGYCDDGYYVKLSAIFSILFYHHGCGYFLLKKELMNAVIKGELHPREFALIYEWAYEDLKITYGDPSRNNLSAFYKTKCPIDKREKYYNLFIDHRNDYTDTTAVNKCRKELGIASIQHDYRKMEFAKKNFLILYFGLFRII